MDSMPQDQEIVFPKGAQAGSAHPLCSDDAAGVTYMDNGWLVLCSDTLNLEDWSLNLRTINKGDYIDDHAWTIAGTFIHEWGHLLTDGELILVSRRASVH